MDRTSLTLLILGLSSLTLINCQTQPQVIKAVRAGMNPNLAPNITAVIPDTPAAEAARRNTGVRFRNAVSLCARGIWALYNNTDFGEGSETSTSVIVIKSTDINSCPSNIPSLPKTQSVNYLGNPDMNAAGLDIYGSSYFLGAAWKLTGAENLPPSTTPPQITGFPLGSLAITGATNKWRICGDADCNNAVCVDMSLQTGGLFMVPNAAIDSTSWPKVVRSVQVTTDSAVCAGDYKPATPTTRVSSVSAFNMGPTTKKGVVEVVSSE